MSDHSSSLTFQASPISCKFRILIGTKAIICEFLQNGARIFVSRLAWSGSVCYILIGVIGLISASAAVLAVQKRGI